MPDEPDWENEDWVVQCVHAQIEDLPAAKKLVVLARVIAEVMEYEQWLAGRNGGTNEG